MRLLVPLFFLPFIFLINLIKLSLWQLKIIILKLMSEYESYAETGEEMQTVRSEEENKDILPS